jgi:hypothetical protein
MAKQNSNEVRYALNSTIIEAKIYRKSIQEDIDYAKNKGHKFVSLRVNVENTHKTEKDENNRPAVVSKMQIRVKLFKTPAEVQQMVDGIFGEHGAATVMVFGRTKCEYVAGQGDEKGKEFWSVDAYAIVSLYDNKNMEYWLHAALKDILFSVPKSVADAVKNKLMGVVSNDGATPQTNELVEPVIEDNLPF